MGKRGRLAVIARGKRGRAIGWRAAAILMLWLASAPGAEAAPRCQDVRLAFPGLKLGVSFAEVRAEVPKAAGCAPRDDVGCEYVDAFGVLNVFSTYDSADPGQRSLFLRQQVRRRGGPLPFGLKWSDPQAEALRKLRPYGVQPTRNPRIFWVNGCGPHDFGYWVNFSFDRNGRLWRVEQGYQVN